MGYLFQSISLSIGHNFGAVVVHPFGQVQEFIHIQAAKFGKVVLDPDGHFGVGLSLNIAIGLEHFELGRGTQRRRGRQRRRRTPPLHMMLMTSVFMGAMAAHAVPAVCVQVLA